MGKSDSQHAFGQQPSLLNKGFLECVFMQFLGYMAFGMTMPVLPMHIVQLSGSATAAGAVTGLFALCALVMRPFAGFVSDRVNKKHLQTLGFLMCALGSAGYAFSPSVGVLVVFRVIHSLGFCLQSTVTIAVTLSMVPKGQEGEGVGYFSLTQVVASALAPLVGVAVAQNVGCPTTFILDACCVLLGALVSSRIPYTHIPAQARRNLQLADFLSVKSVPLALVACLFAVCSGITSSYIVLLCNSRGIAGGALFFSVSAVLMFITRPKAGKLLDKGKVRTVLLPSFFFEAATVTLIACAHSLWMIVLAALLRAFGQGVAQPSVQAQIMRREGPERSGVASSTFNLGLDLGQGIGTLVGGFLAGAYGYGAAFAFCPAALAVALVLFLVTEALAPRRSA